MAAALTLSDAGHHSSMLDILYLKYLRKIWVSNGFLFFIYLPTFILER